MLMDASSSVQEVHTQFVHPFPKPPLVRRPSGAGVDFKGIPGEKFIRPTPRPSTGSTTKSSHSRSSKASEGGSITLHVVTNLAALEARKGPPPVSNAPTKKGQISSVGSMSSSNRAPTPSHDDKGRIFGSSNWTPLRFHNKEQKSSPSNVENSLHARDASVDILDISSTTNTANSNSSNIQHQQQSLSQAQSVARPSRALGFLRRRTGSLSTLTSNTPSLVSKSPLGRAVPQATLGANSIAGGASPDKKVNELSANGQGRVVVVNQGNTLHNPERRQDVPIGSRPSHSHTISTSAIPTMSSHSLSPGTRATTNATTSPSRPSKVIPSSTSPVVFPPTPSSQSRNNQDSPKLINPPSSFARPRGKKLLTRRSVSLYELNSNNPSATPSLDKRSPPSAFNPPTSNSSTPRAPRVLRRSNSSSSTSTLGGGGSRAGAESSGSSSGDRKLIPSWFRKKNIALPPSKTTVVARTPCTYDVTSLRPVRPRSSSLPLESVLADNATVNNRTEHMVTSRTEKGNSTEEKNVPSSSASGTSGRSQLTLHSSSSSSDIPSNSPLHNLKPFPLSSTLNSPAGAISPNTTSTSTTSSSSPLSPPSTSTPPSAMHHQRTISQRAQNRYASVYRPPPPVDEDGVVKKGHPKPALSLSMPSGLSIIEPLPLHEVVPSTSSPISPYSTAAQSTPLSSTSAQNRPPPKASIPHSPTGSPERGLKALPLTSPRPPALRSFSSSPKPSPTTPLASASSSTSTLVGGVPLSRQRATSATNRSAINSNQTKVDEGEAAKSFVDNVNSVSGVVPGTAGTSGSAAKAASSSGSSTNNHNNHSKLLPPASDKLIGGTYLRSPSQPRALSNSTNNGTSTTAVSTTDMRSMLPSGRRPSLPIHVPSVVPEHPEGGAENSEELWGYFERKGLTPSQALDVNRSMSANAVIPKRTAKLTLSPSLNSLSTTTTRPPVKMTQRITRAHIPQDVEEDGFDTTRPAVSILSPRTILSSSPRTPQTASSIRTPALTADGHSPISPYTPRTPVYFSKPTKPRAQRSLTDSKVIVTGVDRPATRPSHNTASLLSTNGRLPPPPALPLQSGSSSPNRAISPNRPKHLASHSSSAALPSPSEPSSSMAQAQSQSRMLYVPPPPPSPPFESIIPPPFDTDEDFALSLPSLGVTMPVTPSTPGTPWMGVDSSRKDPDADSIIIPPSPGFPLSTAEERHRKNLTATR